VEPCEGEVIIVTVFEIKEKEVLWVLQCLFSSSKKTNGSYLVPFG
jgi:hypothetical protein